MRLVVLNANTSTAVTAELGRRAASVARPGTEVVAIQPHRGPESVQGWTDAYRSAAAMLERMTDWNEPFDALVVAGFGDVGRDALRELLDVPVVDITEAAVMAAQLVGARYGIVTTLGRMRPLIEASLAAAGQLERCASIQALELGVLSVADDPNELATRFAAAAQAAVAEGADVLCLGSGALSACADRLARLVDVPVVDAVAAGIAWAEACVQLGLRTSAAGSWALGGRHHAPHVGEAGVGTGA